MMKIAKAQKIPVKNAEPTVEELLARFCYYYQQYTYKQAENLPYKRVVQMLKVARQEQAKEWYNLARAYASSQSKDGFKNYMSELKEIINS